MSKPIKAYRYQVIDHNHKQYVYTDTHPGQAAGVEVLPIERRKTIPNNGYTITFINPKTKKNV
jgi:hypothetical protein